MKIKDKLNFQTKLRPITFAPDDTVRQALDVMCEKNIGSTVVVDSDNKIVGIVTERDLMIRMLGARRDPDETKLADIMTTEVKVATEDDDLVDWMQTMSHERFRHLPIVDNRGNIINMMSQGDFVAHTWPDLYEKVKRDIKGRLGKSFQILLVVLAIVTLVLVALNL